MAEISAWLGALPGAIAQGMIWGIMAIGVYITYKILDFADLTVDGSICTGMAVCGYADGACYRNISYVYGNSCHFIGNPHPVDAVVGKPENYGTGESGTSCAEVFSYYYTAEQ